MPLISSHNAIGSDSTATLGPSAIELITLAALSWTVIMSVLILVVLIWCLFHREMSDGCKLLVCLLQVCVHKDMIYSFKVRQR